MLDHDGPGEAAAEMKPTFAHVCPPPDPAHGSDGGHAWATPGGAARPRGLIRRSNSRGYAELRSEIFRKTKMSVFLRS